MIVKLDWHPYPAQPPQANYGNYYVTILSPNGKEKNVSTAVWEKNEYYSPDGVWYEQKLFGTIIAWAETFEIEPYGGDGFALI